MKKHPTLEAESLENLVQMLPQWAKDRSRPNGKCIEWVGRIDRWGYGTFGHTHRTAHRLVYQHVHRITLPPEVCVLHSCDNPKCVSPGHLWEGSTMDNVRDRSAKGRGASGETNANSKLNERGVLAIRGSSLSVSELARRYGVTKDTIWLVKSGERWRHVLASASIAGKGGGG